MPETVRYIGTCCFCECENLKALQLPNSLKNIENCAFDDSGIQSITIPASVTDLGSFRSCPQLKSLIIVSSKTSLQIYNPYGWFATDKAIPEGAFEKLEYIFIGRNLEGFEWNQGVEYSACNNLTKVRIGEYVTEFGASFVSTLEIICEPTSPPETIGNCSPKCLQTSTVYVPQSAIELYREDPYWGLFKNIKALEEL